MSIATTSPILFAALAHTSPTANIGLLFFESITIGWNLSHHLDSLNEFQAGDGRSLIEEFFIRQIL